MKLPSSSSASYTQSNSGAVGETLINDSSATKKNLGKAAISTSNQSDLPQTNRYNATALPTTSGQTRAASILSRQKLSEPALPSNVPTQEVEKPTLTRTHGKRESPAIVQVSDSLFSPSSKANRSNPIPSQPELFPERLQQKVNNLDLSRLKKLNKDLHEYAENAINYARSGQGPDSIINELDKKLLPLLAQAENQRNPGLNLQTFKNDIDCYQAIKDQNAQVQESKESKNMRVIFPPVRVMPDHHIALDIQLKPGHGPSIAAFESALDNLIEVLPSLLKTNIPDADIKVVPNTIQNSQWDCVMFSLSNILKAYKHTDGFTQDVHDGKSSLIPPDFLKHAHSKHTIKYYPEKNAIVTKEKHGITMETLEHRNLAYRAQRENGAAYSTSIEGFRLQEIQRAGEFLESQNAIAKKEHKGPFSLLKTKLLGK